REAALLGGALLINQHGGDTAGQLAARLDGLIIVCAPARPAIEGEHFTVDRPDTAEQRRLWRQALEGRTADPACLAETLAGQYRLGARRIAGTAARIAENTDAAQLHRLCRTRTSAINDLAQIVDARAEWDDLILPDAQRFTLEQIAVH